MKTKLTILAILLSVRGFCQISFDEIQQQVGISDQRFNYGCYLGDYNNDGYDDVFITRRSGDIANSLYRNNGNGSFTETTNILNNQSKYSSTAVWFDYNNDGWQDLFIANNVSEGHVLLRNNRNETFTDVTPSAGVGGVKKETKSVNAADLNGDGWLDLYLNSFDEDNEFYINNQDGSFTESARISGINNKGRAMGVVIFDFDNDLDLDIFLTFDGQPFVLYENNGNAQFIDVARRTNTNLTGFGMGVDIADINNDGFFDLYVTNLYENFLMVSNGDYTFSEIGKKANVHDLGMGWGCNFADFNNDGLKDIYVTNEFGFTPIENVLYENKGEMRFERVSDSPIIDSRYSGFGSAISDLNNDGKQDIFIANNNYNLQILENKSSAQNWIKLKLLSNDRNIHAIGAKAEIITANGPQLDQITAGSGHASQSSNYLHFGIGSDDKIITINITWPDGVIETYNDIEPNNTYLIRKKENLQIFNSAMYISLFPSTTLEPPLALKVKNETTFYPNPVDDYLIFKKPTKNILLYNSSGQKMSIDRHSDDHLQLDVTSFKEGLYYLYVNDSWEKLIIKH